MYIYLRLFLGVLEVGVVDIIMYISTYVYVNMCRISCVELLLYKRQYFPTSFATCTSVQTLPLKSLNIETLCILYCVYFICWMSRMVLRAGHHVSLYRRLCLERKKSLIQECRIYKSVLKACCSTAESLAMKSMHASQDT